jgi:N-methylhydantoinase B
VPPAQEIILRLPGGGGFYPPFERDPELVQEDVRNGYVSVSAARSAYGVWIEEGTHAIDWAKTAELRSPQTEPPPH